MTAILISNPKIRTFVRKMYLRNKDETQAVPFVMHSANGVVVSSGVKAIFNRLPLVWEGVLNFKSDDK